MTDHAHHYIVDNHNIGTCKSCETVTQFTPGEMGSYSQRDYEREQTLFHSLGEGRRTTYGGSGILADEV